MAEVFVQNSRVVPSSALLYSDDSEDLSLLLCPDAMISSVRYTVIVELIYGKRIPTLGF